MTKYFDELCEAMRMLSEDPRVVFIGQAVEWPGTAMFNTLKKVEDDKKWEVPVFENTQLGMCIGASLKGFIPVCIFPRINFLLEATGQLVSHLDKMSWYSDYKPKVIIRTAVATEVPLNPGPQHLGDYTYGFEQMLDTIKVVELDHEDEIAYEYEEALRRDNSTLLVEFTEKY